MSKWYRVPVPVSNLANRLYFRYRFGTGIHRFLPSNTSVVPVSTGTEPYHTRYIQYRYPLLGISVTVGTELIKSCSNVTIQVIAPFSLE
ncbi:hypothetical protein Hanom_Chr13g01214571 [Helianthus anomalus]